MLNKIILKGKEARMSDDEFFAFCQANPELNIERSQQREIIIKTPTGCTSGFINSNFNSRLGVWNKKHKLGLVFDSSTGFTPPDQSVKSQDASWLSLEKWKQISPARQEKFAREDFQHKLSANPILPAFSLELAQLSLP